MQAWQVERRKRTRHLIELGGLVVKVGSRMIDSSLRSKLNGMRLAMRGTTH